MVGCGGEPPELSWHNAWSKKGEAGWGEGAPIDLKILEAGLPPGERFLLSRMSASRKPADGNKAEALQEALEEDAMSQVAKTSETSWPNGPCSGAILPPAVAHEVTLNGLSIGLLKS